MALFFVASGCAQFQWSASGPGSPGRKNVVLPLPVASGPSDEAMPDLASFEPAPPFSSSDRERIAPIQPLVEQVAQEHRIDPDLISGIIWVESRFQVRAKSPAGARGLMQLMPATADAMARQMGRPIARSFDPEFNVEAGTFYLFKLLDRYDGDETLALAAYNAGSGNVSRWMREDGELPPRSLEYVENVQRARLRFIAMRDERSPNRTMLASASPETERAPEVPTPPASSRTRSPRNETRDDSRTRPTRPARPAPVRTRTPEPTPEPEPEPRTNPLAPSPDVYRPEPTPEPPLEDTPYQPFDEHETDDGDVPTPVRPRTLPSVLD